MTNATLTAELPANLRRTSHATELPKPRIASSDAVRPSELSEEARAQLATDIQGLCAAVFGGPNAGPLATAVASGAAGDVTLCRYFDATGRLVGFNAAILTELELDGVPYAVFRAMAGILPEFRGGQTIAAFWAKVLLAYRLRNPRRRLYFFTPVAHISSFRVLAKHLPTLYPYAEPTEEATRLMRLLKERFHYGPVEGASEWIVNRGTWTKEYESVTRRLAKDDALTRFWKRANPHPERGDCLLSLFPVTAGALVIGMARYAATQLGRRLGLSGARGPAQAALPARQEA